VTRPLPVLLALAALLGGCAGELYANEVALGGGEPAQGLGVAVVNVDTDVGQNSPPVITSLKISPEQPSSTVDISMNYAFDDPDGDIPVPQYVWRVNGAQVSVASRLKAHLFDKDDVISAELVLTDAEGATDRAALEVTVQDGSAPVVHRCSIDPLTLDVTTELSAGALATHPDGDAVALRFSWQRRHANGAWEDLPVSQVRTLAPCLDRADADCQPDDEFRVQCEAEDAVHGTSHRISSAVARLVNRGPDLVSLAFDPSPPRPGVAVEALVEAEDLDDGIDTTAYTWTVDGVVVSTEPTLPGDAVTLDATLTLDVVVTDPSGDSDAGSLSVTVGNSPPVVDRCSVTPGPTPVAQDWFAFAEGTDPDGDTLTNRIYWEMWLDLDGPGPGGWSWVTLPGEEGETAPSCADRRAPYGTPEAAYNCFSGGQYRARCEIEDAHGARRRVDRPRRAERPGPGESLRHVRPCGRAQLGRQRPGTGIRCRSPGDELAAAGPPRDDRGLRGVGVPQPGAAELRPARVARQRDAQPRRAAPARDGGAAERPAGPAVHEHPGRRARRHLPGRAQRRLRRPHRRRRDGTGHRPGRLGALRRHAAGQPG
jgi:hypothetical protein